MKAPLKIIRISEVLTSYFPLSRSTFYLNLKAGLLPPSISLGEKSVGYIEHEYETVLEAMIAGNNNEEIKALVKSLVKQRQELITTQLGE